MSADPAERMDIDERPLSDHSDQPPAPESDGEPAVLADLMVVSRARRSNAGNRMSTLLAQTAAEGEEWGEEWEEAADEEDFVGDDANNQDDYNLNSSESEDEDEGGDDDAGEKELQKAERQERSKKRKPATNPFTARLAFAARKKVKLNVPTSEALSAPPPRPKKKSERASWIPTPEDGPTRMSSRKQTVLNKEHTLAKLKEKDRRRDDTLAMMKAAEARKAKDEPKALTQAERLAEAARVEKVNSKSLHRWEEAEEQRAAERQAKLDALKNRQIQGPFIRYYSGPAIWIDDKLKYTGKEIPKIEDLEEKYNKDIPSGPESENHQMAASMPKVEAAHQTPLQHPPTTLSQTSQTHVHTTPLPSTSPNATRASPTGSHSIPHSSAIVFAPPQNPDSFLFGIEQYATEQQDTDLQSDSQPPPQPPNVQVAPESPSAATQPIQNDVSQPSQAPPLENGYFQPNCNQIPPNPFAQESYQSPFSQPHPSLSDPSLTQSINPQSLLQSFQRPPQPLPASTQAPLPTPKQRRLIRRALRNLLILSSFPNLDTPPPTTKARTTISLLKEKDKSTLIQVSTTLFGWSHADASTFVTAFLGQPKSSTKKAQNYDPLPPVKRELCAVTNQPARYRDPETGIAYRDLKAFKVLRGVVGGGFVWSGALGCYVGGRAQPGDGRDTSSTGVKPAAGVPKRFLEMPRVMSSPPVPAPVADTDSKNGNGDSRGGNGAVGTIVGPTTGDASQKDGECEYVKIEDSAAT